MFKQQAERTGHLIQAETFEVLNRLASEAVDRGKIVEARLRKLEAEQKALQNVHQVVSAVKAAS